jgi:hypothetical protein
MKSQEKNKVKAYRAIDICKIANNELKLNHSSSKMKQVIKQGGFSWCGKTFFDPLEIITLELDGSLFLKR